MRDEYDFTDGERGKHAGKLPFAYQPLPFQITKEEALDRLATGEIIETRFECRPNTGFTYVQKMHVIAARISIRACVSVARSGSEAQKLDFGIHVKAYLPGKGWGLVFYKTRPDKRVSDEQLARERNDL